MTLVDGELVASVKSREALRFEFVDEQGWDASCGYAALATLLRRYRGVSADERGLLDRSSRDGRTVVKVSLGELARLARELGYETRAWRTDFPNLVEKTAGLAPLLVHYDRPRGHFALVLSAGPLGVVTADPARGLELLTRQQFLDRWSGVVMAVGDPAQGRQGADAVARAVNSAKGRAALVDRVLDRRP